ncbi:MAG: cell surface protein SprA [Gemmatimonadetes bacterium]|nr:cell surface protein SprA [Gemmatimonadota bacterium]MBT6146153.1 cell surface protein SprA [Gemmatimonadota bacterium]MBT7864461.1 cell surface protein SprA [Gemmatimonadota bacterium]
MRESTIPNSDLISLRPVIVALLLVSFCGMADATIGLEPTALPGSVGRLFEEPREWAPFRPGNPLLRQRSPRQALVENRTSFKLRQVTVDSLGVHYTPQTSGFDAGAPVSMSVDSYLDLAQDHVYHTGWTDAVRSRQRRSISSQMGRGRGRLEWRVPFPAPAPIRRLIGEEGSLRINGSHTASLGGKSQWTAGEVQTLAGRPSKFPTLSMDQESQFAVEGSVGEAINIRITQDTESLGSAFGQSLTDQLTNQIKLDYKGSEDDIFQEVQAGNTTLSLPSTRFVGFNQQHKGLFGIRASGHLGSFKFTTIASHEESESNRQSFRGGAQVDTVEIRDYQYVRNQYFFLDELYKAQLPDFSVLNAGIPDGLDATAQITSLQVYINDFNVSNDPEQLARPGRAFADDTNPNDQRTGYTEVGTWHRLDPDNDYALVRELGYIILRVPVQDRHALAVAYRTTGGDQIGVTTADADSLSLRLIKARDARPEFPTWNLEWKNVYRIVQGFSRGRLFDEDKIRVEVLQEVPGAEPENTENGKSYLQLMGLDTHGQDPGTRADQIIDADYVGLDGSRGVLIFPDQQPFAPLLDKYGLKTQVPEVYEKHQQRDQIESSRYILQVINSSAQQRISLTQGRLAGIDVESVDVRLNGKRLQRGTDYNVTFTGEVTFVGATVNAVADPGADLEITYESQDLIGLGSQQKTLLGMRSEYEFWQGDGVLGGTLLYNNIRSPENRVRVGSEPARTVVWDLDLRARFEAPLLTRLVDALPGLKTAAESDVSIQAEIAQSRPNLNTKGQGYIDDFEGSERPEIISIFRSRWTPASAPTDIRLDDVNRGRLLWYNPYDRFQRTDIWPGQQDQVEAANNRTDVLTLEVLPGDEIETWGGVMTVFGGGVRDFSQSKFLDVWLRGVEGELHLDLGDISEDWIANGKIDTEDEPLPGRTTGDGQVAESEDVGIDGRDDEEELKYYLSEAGGDTTVSESAMQEEFAQLFPDRNPGDPEGDNWNYDPTRNRDNYDRINGTQGNLKGGEGGLRPDTEDLNNDGSLNTRNDYYHYAIDLARDAHEPGTCSRSEMAGTCDDWRLYRIPLFSEDIERVGTPDSSRIEFARLTLVTDEGRGDTSRVQIAQIEIIGNEWQEDDIAALDDAVAVGAEEAFNVTVIGTDENQSYRPPPGVTVRRLANSRVREREQSLVLDAEKIDPGHQVSATKVLSRNADYTKYTRLRMYVHGDSNSTYVADLDSSELELFIRFGADSLNYYEFATPVFVGWDDRNEVDIHLEDLSLLKAELQRGRFDSNGVAVSQLDTVIARPTRRDGAPAIYRVRGNPSMQQVRQLSLGLRNRSEGNQFTGQVYVDELRLDEARNDPGIAAFARINTQLADFLDVDALVDWRSQNFRTIDNTERKSGDLRTTVSTTSNVHKFLPGSWGFSIPVKASYNRDLSLPRFGPNSDVELLANEQDSLRTERRKDFFEFSVTKRSGTHWLSHWTLDQVNLRMSQTRERNTSPVTPVDDRDSQIMNFSYKMPFPKPKFSYLAWLPEFMPASMRKSELSPLPTTMNYNVNVNRQESTNWRATQRDTTFNEVFDLKETYAGKYSPLRSLSADYNLQVNRDLRKKFDLAQLAFGREVSRNQKADLKINPRLISWLDPSFTFSANYQESSDPRRRRQAAVLDTLTGIPIQTIDITTKNTVTARMNVRLPQLLKFVGAQGERTRGVRARAHRRATAIDSAEAVAAPEEQSVPQPFIARRFLYFVSSYIEPFNTTWRRSTDGRNFNLVERPPLFYQIGIEDSLTVGQQGSGLTQQDSRSRSTDTDMSTGLRLPMGFSVKSTLKETQSKRSGSTQDRLRVERRRQFPSLTVNWGRADRIPYMKRFLNSAQVNVRYDESATDQGEGDLRDRNLINQSESTEWRASWTGQWRIGPTTRFEVSRSASDDLDYEQAEEDDSGVPRGRPPLRGSGGQERNKTSLDVRYKLRPRHLPLLGKLKSNVDLRFELSLESDVRSSGTGAERPVAISSTNRSKAELKATYSFSESFRGEGIMRFENDRNNITDRTRKVRELRMSGTLFFR